MLRQVHALPDWHAAPVRASSSDIADGRGTLESLDELQACGQDMELLSNCGLGQTASVAVRDILKHFRPKSKSTSAITFAGRACARLQPHPAPLSRTYETSLA